jgi:hypothetical protein
VDQPTPGRPRRLATDQAKQGAASGNRTRTYALRASPVHNGRLWLVSFDAGLCRPSRAVDGRRWGNGGTLEAHHLPDPIVPNSAGRSARCHPSREQTRMNRDTLAEIACVAVLRCCTDILTAAVASDVTRDQSHRSTRTTSYSSAVGGNPVSNLAFTAASWSP